RVHDSPEAAVLIADKAGAAGLLDSAQAAFVAGMDHLLWVCAAVAIGGAIMTWLACPARPDDVTRSQWERDHAFEGGGTRPTRTQEHPDPASNPGTSAASVRRARICRNDHGANRRRGRGVAQHVFPVLPNQGRNGLI